MGGEKEPLRLSELRQFLVAANSAGYGNSETVIATLPDGGHLIEHRQDPWLFRDIFYGGHPYAGQEVIYSHQKPVWAMQYRGWLTQGGVLTSDVYNFLKDALLQPPPEYPWRGPQRLKQDDWLYLNNWQGELSQFSGQETISYQQNEVYCGLYFGGLVDSD